MTHTQDFDRLLRFLTRMGQERIHEPDHPVNSLDPVETHQVVSLAFALSAVADIDLYDEVFVNNDVATILDAAPYGVSAYLTFQRPNHTTSRATIKDRVLAVTSTTYHKFSETSAAVFDALDRDIISYFKTVSVFNYFNGVTDEALSKAGFHATDKLSPEAVMFASAAPIVAESVDAIDELATIRDIAGIPYEHVAEMELSPDAGTFLSNGTLFTPSIEENLHHVCLAQVWMDKKRDLSVYPGAQSTPENDSGVFTGRSISLTLSPPDFEGYMKSPKSLSLFNVV